MLFLLNAEKYTDDKYLTFFWEVLGLKLLRDNRICNMQNM
jgi:hypothetical protein